MDLWAQVKIINTKISVNLHCFFWCCCSGEGRKRSQLSIPATSIYTLGGHDIHLANMVGIVKPPGGAPEPCMLTKKPDGKLGT